MTEHVDVIVVGAGLSGIGAAYHLQTRCPDCSYLILESREAIGGTWDLFRYPGIRSDSDMHTLGYSFKPWTQAKAIADGASIRDYVQETARENGIDRRIRFDHKVVRAGWSSADATWTVETERSDGTTARFTCNFLHTCAGYYDYARGHAPVFAGQEDFAGRIVHPQFWPADLDYAGKRVVVIGSGATAVTLVPEMARKAAHVTMLQRSPTYVVSRPAQDRVANWMRRRLPPRAAYAATRWKNVAFGMFFYRMTRRKPEATKQRLIGMVREHLGPDYDVATHFTPRYNPWDQRLCLVPDADLFDTIKAGRATVVTDTIERFTPAGIRLASGAELPADVIVTATGLEVSLMGGARFSVDGAPADLTQSLQYKGMMFSDVPNLSFTFGYTNASWTLKADLVAMYVCRLLNTMKKRGLRQATPRIGAEGVNPEPFVDFSSGYIQRAVDRLPKQGDRKPWRLNQNYALDVLALRFGSVDDSMEFSNPATREKRAA
jgi:monooxygenase